MSVAIVILLSLLVPAAWLLLGAVSRIAAALEEIRDMGTTSFGAE